MIYGVMNNLKYTTKKSAALCLGFNSHGLFITTSMGRLFL